ncbi:methionyl-tRNA formyltransferase [Puteibacter caeruleilacunae]|nr:methionyl-tRNA formyltransferase [Puteibacter caeruleilacunae]
MNGKDLRIVFMGTPDFAVASLRALVEGGYNIVGVITAPDKPAGRGRQLQMSAVKKYAVEQNINVLQPERLKNPEFIDELKALNADLQVVVAFRMLPELVWNMPEMGTFNLHGSLLPNYRGAAPLNWALINGEKETGVTTFLLKHEIDTGNIIFREKIDIAPKDNVEVVHDKLMVIGADLVVKTVDALAEGNVEFIDQEELIKDGAVAKHAPKIFKDDCLVDWSRDGESIFNLIRGLSPYPAAWSKLLPLEGGKELSFKIYDADFVAEEHGVAPGTIVCDGKKEFKVACANGYLQINMLQLAGKKRMATGDFLRGFQQAANYKAQ